MITMSGTPATQNWNHPKWSQNNHGPTWKLDDFCVFDIGTSVCAAFPSAARDLEQDRLNAALDEAKFGWLGGRGAWWTIRSLKRDHFKRNVHLPNINFQQLWLVFRAYFFSCWHTEAVTLQPMASEFKNQRFKSGLYIIHESPGQKLHRTHG